MENRNKVTLKDDGSLILSIDGVKAVVTTNLQAKIPEEIFE